MNEVINNNKYKLKYWFAMLYIHGRKCMIGSFKILGWCPAGSVLPHGEKVPL